MADPFAGVSFTDPGKCRGILREFELDEGRLAQHLADALAVAADPDALLVRLSHYLRARSNRATERDLMAAAPRYTHLLCTLLSQSDYLTDLLRRNPEHMTWLWDEADLHHTPPCSELAARLESDAAGGGEDAARGRALRHFARREMLRIAAREVFTHAGVREVTEDLSNLADAALGKAVAWADAATRDRYGAPPDAAGFCVLALGKLGGRELNFSSDIDLVFLHGADGETGGGSSGTTTCADYFRRVGERVIKLVSESTEEGRVFRVDMRLRPYGDGAPLSVSMDTALEYYESVGRAWERQAFLKARPCAGDVALGEQFLASIRPFVYPRFFDDETLDDIRATKQQVEDRIARDGKDAVEVKLGRGGIRDIEFTVQMLQLLNGGRLEALRVRSTLDAIDALGKQGFLSAFEAETLASNYNFLRRVEHRLQIRGSRQVHALPTDLEPLEEFARQLGYQTGESFMREYRERTSATREILERFLTAEGSGTRWVYDLLHPQHHGETGLEELRARGFDDPAASRERLIALYAGPADRPNSLRVRQAFTRVVPRLLDEIRRFRQPDTILMRLGEMLGTIRAPGAMYDLLSGQEHLCRYLVTLVANSEYLTEILTREPGLLDTLGAPEALEQPASHGDLEAQLRALTSAYDPDAAPYRLHAGETLRVGLRELLAGASVASVGQELTCLAEVILQDALDKALARVAEKYGPAEGDCGVVGLGKMGGRELGYGSDLDVVFVYEAGAAVPGGMGAGEYFAAVAQRTFNALKERTQHGVLYDVDTRLRPEGSKGVLAVSSDRLAEYYAGEAQAWERLAAMKARSVAGPRPFRQALDAQIRDVVYDRGFDTSDIAAIADIRERLVAAEEEVDLKKGRGGLLDIEFALRLAQAERGNADPAFRTPSVLDALAAFKEGAGPVLTRADAETLGAAYLLLRRVENRVRMNRGTSGSRVPNDPSARDDLAARLGLEGSLREKVDEAMSGVRSVYRVVLDKLK